MRNISGCTRDYIERTFDLKGSTVSRRTIVTKPNSKVIDESRLKKAVLKDMDFWEYEKKIDISEKLT
jgi:hypothetical protein